MILIAASDYSTGYTVGEIVAIVALAAASIWLGLRALDLKGRRAASPARPPALPAGQTSAEASVAPPGWTEPAQPARVNTPAPRVGGSRRARTTDAIAALVCLVLLVGAVVRFVDHHSSSGPFDTAQGRQMHAGFIAGCQQGTSGVIDCDCVWDHLTSASPYDTPEGLMTLAGPVTSFIRTQSTSGLPPQYVEAAKACVGG